MEGTLFMLESLDGKISSRNSDELIENIKIPINYFYQMFIGEFNKIIMNNTKQNRIGEPQYDLDYFSPIPKDQQLSIYYQILYDICLHYVCVSNSPINILPANTLEFVDLILDTIHENPYKESFLQSLQFIYQALFDCLGKGCPTLMSSKDSELLPSFNVVLDSQYRILDFKTINMDLIEETKTMTKIFLMESNNQIGPIPKVLHRIREYY